MMRAMRSLSLGLLLIVALAGGGGSKPAPASPQPAANDDAAGCEKMFARQRECTDVFIPALVGWRVELDVPAGVAARDQAEGRQALVDQALTEWAEDSKEEKVRETCAAILASIPAERLAPMREAGEACMATADCQAFVACMEPMHRQRLQAQKGAPPAAE
jgi:hypothetical protein